MLKLHKEFLDILSEAQSHRNEREWILGEEPAWLTFEKETMLKEVNARRESFGKEPVSMMQIDRLEMTASGHVDYSSKFALYCSELVTME